MKFVLEVELDDLASDADASWELGRILRYWAGNLKHYELAPGAGSVTYDSRYCNVGQWVIVNSSPPTQSE